MDQSSRLKATRLKATPFAVSKTGLRPHDGLHVLFRERARLADVFDRRNSSIGQLGRGRKPVRGAELRPPTGCGRRATVRESVDRVTETVPAACVSWTSGFIDPQNDNAVRATDGSPDSSAQA
ncbi:MAG: hypothetical protein ACYTG0_16240 [Planctomycetota bacterium]|jgi:hypothetical protein